MTTMGVRRFGRTFVAACVLAIGSMPALAQVPLGPEFRVSTLPCACGFGWMDDRSRSVSVAPDGRFVVAWTTIDEGGYFRPYDIAARIFDSRGFAKTPDFRVNSYTTEDQRGESIASDDAGNFVVVWDGVGPNQPSSSFGQRFDAGGTRLGAEFRVNSVTTNGAHEPFVAMRPTGEFAIVWWSPFNGVFARQFTATGIPTSAEFLVSPTAPDRWTEPSVDFDGAGNFVVAWQIELFSSKGGVAARLFDTTGSPLGPEFRVDAGTWGLNRNHGQRVARTLDGSFVVAWADDEAGAVKARRFDPSGTPLGGEIVIDSQASTQSLDLDVDADGDWVIVWRTDWSIFGKRYDSAGMGGATFQVDHPSTVQNKQPSVSSEPGGNFVVTWESMPVWPTQNMMARRYAGGLSAAALAVDELAGPASDGNGVLEAGETVRVIPSWLNANFTAQTFTGVASSFTGGGAPGDPTYTIVDGAADYGTVAVNATTSCDATADCYAVGVTVPTTRPAVHWDATFHEDISPATLRATKTWSVHVGESFADVPRASGFYRFVETLLHHGVTSGCTPSTYCPSSSATREQMAVFVLVAKEGPGFVPPACVTPVFNDVPATSPFCPWIEELARRGVAGGCGGGGYCPSAAVSREQMAVFVLATKEPGVTPPACATPSRFSDVPVSSPFCRWVEELARRNVVTGCGNGNYCPAAAVTREPMAVFISAGFGLQLYGP